MSRPEQPEAFLRGCAFLATQGVAYPRADPSPLGERLPRDTWQTACLPVGVRFELQGGASRLEIDYETQTEDLGYRGEGAGTAFSVWRGDLRVSDTPAKLGRQRVEVELGEGDVPAILYLPEGMRPVVHALRGLDGDIEPAPRQPRWLCYGDSIAEGWVATTPALAWPAVVGRQQGLDVVNLGYAGSARGEIVTAEQIAELSADLISISYGTNCWTRTPSSAASFRAGLASFLDVLREGHPETPLLAVSPILRPDAERVPNRLGATLSELRKLFEECVDARIAEGDAALMSVPGAALVAPERLPDGIHPDDAGHAAIAAKLGPKLRSALQGGGSSAS